MPQRFHSESDISGEEHPPSLHGLGRIESKGAVSVVGATGAEAAREGQLPTLTCQYTFPHGVGTNNGHGSTNRHMCIHQTDFCPRQLMLLLGTIRSHAHNRWGEFLAHIYRRVVVGDCFALWKPAPISLGQALVCSCDFTLFGNPFPQNSAACSNVRLWAQSVQKQPEAA